MDYAEYVKTLESVGDSILEWADPSHTFRGHTEVRVVALSLRKVKWFELGVILQGLNGCYCRVRAVLSLLRGLLRRPTPYPLRSNFQPRTIVHFR
jgi:hypothetical protein